MKTIFKKQFLKDSEKLPLDKTRKSLVDAIINIEEAASVKDIEGIKKMSGYKFAYRIKMGDYRIGIFIENDTVELARVKHRKDIYKLFP